MRGNPDLIPIENLWQVVYSEYQKAWEIISNSVCEHLVNFRQHRCQAAIDNKGFATNY